MASSMSPQSSTSAASASTKKHFTLRKFFSPASDEKTALADVPEIAELPIENAMPCKKRMTTEDVIKRMAAKGELTIKGQPIEIKKQEMQELQKEIGRKNGIYGGRPQKAVIRGVLGGASTNARQKHEKPLKNEIPFEVKHKVCVEMYAARHEQSSSKFLQTSVPSELTSSKQCGFPKANGLMGAPSMTAAKADSA